MMELDYRSGGILIDNMVFSSELTVSELFDEGKYPIEVKPLIENCSYIIPNIKKGEYSIFLIFNQGLLKTMSISLGKKYNFTPYVVTKKEKKILKEKLIEIGGQDKYIWGDVEFSEDTKGGVVSIVINYK